MRIYLDNNVLTYLLRIGEGKALRPGVVGEASAVDALLKRPEVKPVCSDEALAEIERTPDKDKRARLVALFHRLKGGEGVTRNALVTWDDGVTRWDSPDARWDHPETDNDRDRLAAFFQEKGIPESKYAYDVRYLANAMLQENRIDVFLTADKKTIWNFRNELRDRFGIVVKLPSELLKELEYPTENLPSAGIGIASASTASWLIQELFSG